MSLKLGIYCNKFCSSRFCKDLPYLSHNENNLKNQLLDTLLRSHLTTKMTENFIFCMLLSPFAAMLCLVRWTRRYSFTLSIFYFIPDHLEVTSQDLPQLRLVCSTWEAQFVFFQYFSAKCTETVILTSSERVSNHFIQRHLIWTSEESKQTSSFWLQSYGKSLRTFMPPVSTCSVPLIEEILSYLPLRLPSHILDYIVYESSDKEPVNSYDSSISAFNSGDSAYFSQIFWYVCFHFHFDATPFFYQKKTSKRQYEKAIEG